MYLTGSTVACLLLHILLLLFIRRGLGWRGRTFSLRVRQTLSAVLVQLIPSASTSSTSPLLWMQQ